MTDKAVFAEAKRVQAYLHQYVVPEIAGGRDAVGMALMCAGAAILTRSNPALMGCVIAGIVGDMGEKQKAGGG